MEATLLTGVASVEHDDSDRLYEVIDGVRVEKLVSAYEVGLASIIHQIMGPFAKQHGLGRVVIEMRFEFPSINRQRIPDVAFVSYQQWPQGRRLPNTEAWAIVPELAIEVVSPSNKAVDVIAKMREYFHCGVRCVWIVWPEAEQIYRYSSPTQIQVFTRADTIDGGDVIPGFQLPLAQLFEEETEPAPPAGQSAAPPGPSEQ